MARVNDQTIIEAYIRQEGVCALCGTPLENEAYEAHHMKRKADGGEDSVENIVLLCSREEHEHVHAGNFRKEIETTPDAYPYYNGKNEDLDYRKLSEEKEIEVEEIKNEQNDIDSDELINEGGPG